MPLKLNVGVTKKLGLPAYSSIGASCHLEVELESNLLHDLDGFHAEVRNAFVAAQQAVNDELARLHFQAEASEPPSNGHPDPTTDRDGHAPSGIPRNGILTTRETTLVRPPARSAQPATVNQVRAIVTIARRQRADLGGLLADLGVPAPKTSRWPPPRQLKAAGGA